MAMAVRFISADDHVIEHPEVWTRRLSKTKWGDRIPHLERQADGSDCWLIDGVKHNLLGKGSAGALMADRGTEPHTWSAVPQAAWAPAQRLKALDAAGIDYSVLYPTIAGIAGETFGAIRDPGLELDCVRAYNDWLIDEWAAASNRFIPQCIIPLGPIDTTVAEIKRAVSRGHKGVIMPPVPRHLRDLPHINDGYYDPVWRICEELAVPLCFHAGGSTELQMPAYEGFSPAIAAAFDAVAQPVSAVPIVSNLIVSRVLERFPDLNIVFADTSLGWISFALEATDYEFDQFGVSGQIPYELKPSEAFRRQCYVVGWYDQANLRRACEYPGAANILWAARLPLADSSWPNSLGSGEACLQGLAEQTRTQVLWRNAATLYKVG
jgi:predicted TIM-barrel fold metal-dependent hydrolase